MRRPVGETPGGEQVVVEEYFINGQHFTRSIIVVPGGGPCTEVFAVNKQIVANALTWRGMVNQAQKMTS